MRVAFLIPTPLRPFAEGRSRIDVEVAGGVRSLGEALAALGVIAPGVRDRVLTERGEVRPHVNVFVGTESCRWTGGLATPIADGSEIAILPAISGGSLTREPDASFAEVRGLYEDDGRLRVPGTVFNSLLQRQEAI